MKSQPKSRHVGAGVVTRYRNGACTFTCRHDSCRAYSEPRSWRATVRLARRHAADHDDYEAHYVDTSWGIPAAELPRRRARRSSRFAALLVVLLLLVISSAGTYLAVEMFTTHATSSFGVVR